MAYKSFWFRNEERDSEGRSIGFSGYRPGHKMVLAYPKPIELDCDEPSAAFEEMFRIFNIDHPADYRNRSMSVGDVCVLFTSAAWMAARCASVGWERIDGGVVDLVPKANVLIDQAFFDQIVNTVEG